MPEFSQWLAQLKKARFPVGQRRLTAAESLVGKMPWPRLVKARWDSSRDQDRLKIQLEAESLQDLQSRLEALVQIGEKLQSQNPWSCP